MYLPKDASPERMREAERARKNRLDILQALSHGKITRRDLIKWGIFSSAGLLASRHGLNPLVGQSHAAIPTGVPPSPLFGVRPFTMPLYRFDVLKPGRVASLNPAPMAEANTTLQPVPAVLGGGMGPVEGRPPGPIWAHQGYDRYSPKVAIEVFQLGATRNGNYNPQVRPDRNSGIDPRAVIEPYFHPGLPAQGAQAFWTFNGSVPPKLILARYGEPILFRHHNRLDPDVTRNGGFGRHTISTHMHNAHHGAENDGFTGAYFYPGQFYDYHYPFMLAGASTINAMASDPRCGAPDGNGGITKLPGDWCETMSTHWFHDHMFSFTSQNVYKGIAGMCNLYSAVDRGNETINDGVNLRLPSGRDKDYGNLDYDVNLMLADKAWDRDGQLAFDIFDFDGFLGDVMTVNLCCKPYFEVERRKYRFRILNGSVARFFKIALSDRSPMIQIANDGNLLPHPVVLTELDQLGIAERYDIVIDFSRYSIGTRIHMVNLAEHKDGRRVAKDLALKEALSGKSDDPCVGSFLEFRVARDPAYPDMSQVPATLIPNPDMSNIPVARERIFEFGRGAKARTDDPVTAFPGFDLWGVKTDEGRMLPADFGRISAAPKAGTREVWTLRNGGGWDHPIHIHFEEGQILARDGKAGNVPPWEKGRKDVYRLRPGGSVTITLQFRDWGGMFMEHCHNTVHEDNAMLLRWEINDYGAPSLRPLPTPIPSPQGVKFQAPGDILPTAFEPDPDRDGNRGRGRGRGDL